MEYIHSNQGSFILKQNYPNPFNPITTIEFSIPESDFVELKVYNPLGEQVGLLINEYLSAGNYKATWDARDKPDGVYIYRLSNSSSSQIKKMLSLK